MGKTATVVIGGQKKCRICGIEYPMAPEYFYLRKDSGKYRNECKDCLNTINKEWSISNRDKINAYCRQKRKENPEYYNKISKRYRDRNPEKRYNACTKWRKENPEKANAIQKRSYTKRRSTPSGSINHRVGVAMQISLRGNKNGRSWESLVGYSCADLKKHMEKQFVDGMTWKSFLNGEIHIDHIIPISAFNFIKHEHADFKRCWSLDNLRLLPAHENLRKNNKLFRPFQPALAI